MNIIIGKFGKSINFEPLQWGMIGGDSESAILAQSIAHLYPDDNFYLVSRNNFSKLSIDTQMYQKDRLNGKTLKRKRAVFMNGTIIQPM